MCNVGNLRISEASLSKLEKFQHILAQYNIGYNCTVLFWSQLHCLFIHGSKYFSLYKKILIDGHTKILTEITDIVVFRKKLLKFLQGAIGWTELTLLIVGKKTRRHEKGSFFLLRIKSLNYICISSGIICQVSHVVKLEEMSN